MEEIIRDLTGDFVRDMNRELKAQGKINQEEAWERWKFGGDEAERDKLIVSLTPLVLYVCKKLGVQSGEMDDCVQAGNLSLFTAIESWKPDGGFSINSWVIQALMRDIQRERANLAELVTLDELPEDYEEQEIVNENNEDLDLAVLLPQLESAIVALPESQQKVVELMLQGLTQAEIADVLDISQQAVSKQIGRSIETLRLLMLEPSQG